MKRTISIVFLLLIVAVFSNIFGQRETPAGAGDKNLGEDSIKMRSVEIERIKREANNPESFARINKEIKIRFPQIKEDFESIQTLQAEIIKAYTTGKSINYEVIQASAEGIHQRAKRLDENLFAAKLEKKSDQKEDKVKSIRDLIIALDNSIGSFVGSKIFGNINVVDFDVAVKTRTDLNEILEISEKLAKEANKMK